MKNRRWYVLGFEPETAGVEGWEVPTNPLNYAPQKIPLFDYPDRRFP